MRPRRTAIVPNMIWGTAMASIVPSQLLGCGGSTVEPGSAGSAGLAESAGHGGQIVAEGGKNEGYAGYIVLAVRAFGGAGIGLGGAANAAGASEVHMAGEAGSAGAGGSLGMDAEAGDGGSFIVLAAAAFGGKSQ